MIKKHTDYVAQDGKLVNEMTINDFKFLIKQCDHVSVVKLRYKTDMVGDGLEVEREIEFERSSYSSGKLNRKYNVFIKDKRKMWHEVGHYITENGKKKFVRGFESFQDIYYTFKNKDYELRRA